MVYLQEARDSSHPCRDSREGSLIVSGAGSAPVWDSLPEHGFAAGVSVHYLRKESGMASSIKCRSCGSDIVVETLSPGQVLKCGSCGAENLVPHGAGPRTSEEPRERRELRKPRVAGAPTASPQAGDRAAGTGTAVIFRPLSAMRRDLRNWGIGLIGIGIVSIVFSEILDPIWGGLLILLGVLTLIIRQRGMYIAIGIGLLLAGVMNIVAVGKFGGWMVFGLFQIFIGIQEIRKFWRYA